MGAAMGRETDALAFFASLAEAPYRYDFYQTLRRLECLYADEAALGPGAPSGRRARAARTGPRSVVCARAARVVRAAHGGKPPRLQVRLFGLFGPNGPLPLHLTEYARERLRHAGDPTLSRFLDIFHHRFLALFYRAWAQAQPHVNRDRPKDDRFTAYVGAFVGHVARRRFAIATRCPTSRSSFTWARSSARCGTPKGWRTSSSTSSACPCEIEEFVGHWMLLGARRADAPRARGRDARRRRGARAPRVGSSAQVPDSSRAADPRPVRELPAGRRAASRSWSTGSGCISASSSIGTFACS